LKSCLNGSNKKVFYKFINDVPSQSKENLFKICFKKYTFGLQEIPVLQVISCILYDFMFGSIVPLSPFVQHALQTRKYMYMLIHSTVHFILTGNTFSTKLEVPL